MPLFEGKVCNNIFKHWLFFAIRLTQVPKQTKMTFKQCFIPASLALNKSSLFHMNVYAAVGTSVVKGQDI